MAIPYTAPTISGYNSSPPPDDGSATSLNAVKWATHVSKIGDPLKTYAQAISNALDTAFTYLPDHTRTQAEKDAGVTPTNYQYAEGDLRRAGADGTGATASETAIGTYDVSGITLLVKAGTTYKISANLTIDTCAGLIVEPGGSFSVDSGKTLTISVPLHCDKSSQVFSGAGSVVLSEGVIDSATPDMFGAVADGTTDDATAVNNCANACRNSATTVEFLGSSNYYVESSLNFTGVSTDLTAGKEGWIVKGGGKGSTIVTGNLSTARAIFDLSGSHNSVLRDMRIEGDASGSQLCAVLWGCVDIGGSSPNTTYECTLFNVRIIGANFSEAGLINYSSDLSRIVRSKIAGPNGVIYLGADDTILGLTVASDYQTLITSSGGSTIHTIVDSEISANGSSGSGHDAAVLFDDSQQLSAFGTYFNQGTGSAVFKFTAGTLSSSYSTLQYVGCRTENSGSNNLIFAYIDTDNGLIAATIRGRIAGGDKGTGGTIFYFGSNVVANYGLWGAEVRADISPTPAHIAARAGATGDIRNCDFTEVSDSQLLDGDNGSLYVRGNIIRLKVAVTTNWVGVARSNKIFDSGDGIILPTPDESALYRIAVNNAGTVTSTVIS